MKSWIPILAFGIIAIGCGDGSDTVQHQGSPSSNAPKGADTGAPTIAASSPSTATPAAITLSKTAYHDLTGDGAAERFSVKATGPTWDSLTIRLQIRSAKDSLLYYDQWTSMLYFVYTPRKGKSDAEVERIVRRHFDRLLADSAFRPISITDARGRRVPVDTERVRYSLAEQIWREQHGLRASDTTPPDAHTAIGNAQNVPADRLSRVIAEVKGRPTFTYFAGGEATYTVAWSPSENRFVVVWACC